MKGINNRSVSVGKRGPRRKSQRHRPWSIAEIKQLGKAPDSVLARQTGRGIKEITQEREARRIALPIKRRWTAREIRLLGTINDNELARRLRRTPYDIYRQRTTLKVAPFKARPKADHYTPPRPWLPEEDKLLGTMRDDHLAQQLGRLAKSVTYRRRQLGIPRAFAPLWTPDQDALLGTKRDQDIAKLLNRTPGAVSARRLTLEISLSPTARLRPKPHLWMAHELRLLGRFTDADAASQIGCSLVVARKKRLEMKIPLQREITGVKSWTREEDELVGTMPEDELARRLGRSLAAITHRRIKLGRSVYRPIIKRWTETELALLGKLPDHELAVQTGRSLNSVKCMRWQRGLPAPSKTPPWAPEEERLLGTCFDKDIAARLSRTKWAVFEHRNALGIPSYGVSGRPKK